VGNNMGKIYVYADRFRFATSEDENPAMALEASWSMLEVVKSQNSDVLILEVAHTTRWYFDNIDNQSSIFSVIDNYTGRNKTSIWGKGALPSFGTGTSLLLLSPSREHFLMEKWWGSERKSYATGAVHEYY